MTKEQMLKGFERLGGVTPENAIILAIEKYKDLPNHWESLISGEPGWGSHYPKGDNCPLCYAQPKVKNITQCSGCPLFDPKEHDENPDLDCCTEYERVIDVIGTEDKQEFEDACESLVVLLEDALVEDK